MATSSTSVWEPTASQIIRSALLELGILHASDSPDTDQLALGMDILNRGMNAMIVRGVAVNLIERYEQTLTADDHTYTAPADTETIEGTATVTDTNDTDGQVFPITREEYMAITDKTVTGRPTMYFAEKTGPSTHTIYLFPVPDSTVETFTYVRTRRFRDTDTGARTLDIPRKFIEPMVTLLQWKFARHYKLAPERIKDLKTSYEDEIDLALNDEVPHGNLQFVVPNLFMR